MPYRSRRADLASEEDVEALRDLHELCFGTTAPQVTYDKGAWWLVYKVGGKDPMGFGGIVPSTLGPGYAYLKRSGILPDHRGHGLQRRLIAIRERWARKEGFHTVVTDTCDNTPSANNLIRSGYFLFEPKPLWGLKGGLYFKKPLGHE